MSYVVQRGDTLGAIANRHGTTVQSLLSENPSISDPSKIFPGQRIAVPSTTPVQTPVVPTPPAPSAYVVQPGDTLGKIAAQNGTTVNDIMAVNPQITNPNRLSVGQQINLPGARAGGSSGGTSPGPRPANPQPQPTPQNNTPITSPDGDWTLPTSGTALKLVPADFDNAARELGCEAAAVRAVATVESGGRSGFDAQKRPKILFEIHKFRKHTGGRYDASHPHLSAPYKSPLRRQSYKKDQWVVIGEAFGLDPESAVKSASWGMFQVLGEYYKDYGWTSVRTFVDDMFASEAQHMRMFLGFCRVNNLTRHLKTKNWAAFARGYNGPDYASNHYDTKLAEAYRRYSRG